MPITPSPPLNVWSTLEKPGQPVRIGAVDGVRVGRLQELLEVVHAHRESAFLLADRDGLLEEDDAPCTGDAMGGLLHTMRHVLVQLDVGPLIHQCCRWGAREIDVSQSAVSR